MNSKLWSSGKRALGELLYKHSSEQMARLRAVWGSFILRSVSHSTHRHGLAISSKNIHYRKSREIDFTLSHFNIFLQMKHELSVVKTS
jgi:hypothetical protein